jgi:hypothetical protein
MENKENVFDSLSQDNYKHQLDIWFKAYNISHEKIELFHDFFLSLYENINSTYLGADVMENYEDQKGHFTWCWNKTIKSFTNEKIYFRENGIHFEYMWNFFHEAFYYVNLDERKDKILEYIEILFKFNHKKTRAELDVLTELYKLLNEGLKKQ